jgi:catechol 2,3-dioxygenase-like lactoylglutathione lyase family enzyme
MIKSTEHFSFTVSNLNDSLHFFCDLLGLSATPAVLVDSASVQTIIGMPGARLLISDVQLPDGGSIELIEYVEPKGATIDLATRNAGVAHIAFGVEGIQKMYEELSAHGVEFVSAPVWDPQHDGKGKWAHCYLRGPDGISLEFIERTP